MAKKKDWKAEAEKYKTAAESEFEFTKYFVDQSIDRGKALSVVLPLIGHTKMIDLLTELYNKREQIKELLKNKEELT